MGLPRRPEVFHADVYRDTTNVPDKTCGEAWRGRPASDSDSQEETMSMLTAPETSGDPSTSAVEGSWYGRWLPRTLVVTIVATAAWFGSRWIFTSLSDFLITIVFAVFIAMALLPAVERLTKRGWRRGSATGVVMLAGAVFFLVFVGAVTNVVVGQVAEFLRTAPDYLDDLSGVINDTTGAEVEVDTILVELEQYEGDIDAIAVDALDGVFGLASSTLGLLFQLLTLGLFVFYILADLPRLRAAILRRFPESQQIQIDTVLSIAIDKTGGYVYTRATLAVLSALFHFVAFALLGLPYPLALALWMGLISQFIPTVGTYIAGALPVIIALLDDPVSAIWVLAVIIVYQQIENYAIEPQVSSDTLDLHPGVAFAAVIAGGALLGGLGAILALPVAASVTALVQTYGVSHEVIKSSTFADPEDYEAQMLAATEEDAQARADKRGRWPRSKSSDSNNE
jgi:predicted PurR-regulated permease PerM